MINYLDQIEGRQQLRRRQRQRLRELLMHIVCIDNGDWYVGECQRETFLEIDAIRILDAQMIVRDEKGIGGVALNGPGPNDTIIASGLVIVPVDKIIHFIETQAEFWRQAS